MTNELKNTQQDDALDVKSKIVGALSTIATIFVIFAVGRGILFPSTVVEETVELRQGQYYAFGYTPKNTNRKLTIELKSLNGVGVEAAIIPSSYVEPFNEGRMTLSEAAGNAEGAYSPTLVEGTVSRYITTDDEWFVVLQSDRDAQVQITGRTLLRF